MITFRWQALGPISRDYSIFLQQLVLNADARRRVAQLDTYHAYGSYPTGEWQADQIVVDSLRLAPYLEPIPPGDLSLVVVGLYDAATGERLRAQPLGSTRSLPDQSVIVGEVYQTSGGLALVMPGTTPVVIEEFVPPEPVGAQLGDAVELVGYALDRREVRPGETLVLRLYWRALQAVSGDYTVFTHLLDVREKIVAQQDNPPRGGTHPTSRWRVGALIGDEYRLVVDPKTPPGEHLFQVGMCLPESGQRLGVVDKGSAHTGDRVILGAVVVTLTLSRR